MPLNPEDLMPKGWTLHQEHLRTYLESDGRDGQFVDHSKLGGSAHTTTLLMKAYGRTTGRAYIYPLIYAAWGPAYVVTGSKGASPEHPGWYKNLIARPEVDFQVGQRRWRGTWRELEGEERRRCWDYLSVYFPSYAAMQAQTERQFPVVALTPGDEIGPLYPL